MTTKNDSEVSETRPLESAVRTSGSKYDRLVARAKTVPPAKTIVVHPCDETSLRGLIEAAEIGIIVPILVGPAKQDRRRRT